MTAHGAQATGSRRSSAPASLTPPALLPRAPSPRRHAVDVRKSDRDPHAIGNAAAAQPQVGSARVCAEGVVHVLHSLGSRHGGAPARSRRAVRHSLRRHDGTHMFSLCSLHAHVQPFARTCSATTLCTPHIHTPSGYHQLCTYTRGSGSPPPPPPPTFSTPRRQPHRSPSPSTRRRRRRRAAGRPSTRRRTRLRRQRWGNNAESG